jgi:hypothetical protein
MPSRILREGILSSPRIAKLDWMEELFFRRLMSVVDDYGRYFADLGLLHTACFPRQHSKVTDQEIADWLGACEDAGLVSVYTAEDGERYLILLRLGGKIRAVKSRFPDPHSTRVADAMQTTGTSKAPVHLDVCVSAIEGERAVGPSFVLPDWIPEDTWAAYLKTRSRKKAGNEPHALGLIVKDLEKFRTNGHDPVTVLNNSIKSGWAGVFQPQVSGDVRATTVPGRIGPDPELQRIEAERKLAVPPPAETRARLAAFRRKEVN